MGRKVPPGQKDFGYELRDAWRSWKFDVRIYVLQNAKVRSQAKASLFALLSLYGDRNFAFPSYKWLSRRLGLSIRQVMRIFKGLVAAGLLRREIRSRRDGGNSANAWKILFGNVARTIPHTHNSPSIARAVPHPASFRVFFGPAKCH